MPILLFRHGTHPFVAAVHGGWRGLAGDIVGKTLTSISEYIDFSPEELTVIGGPHICSCCFQVGREVVEAFGEEGVSAAVADRDFVEKYRLNLGMILERRCRALGIEEKRIHISSLCTACNTESFFSYRRAGYCDRGSLAAVISISSDVDSPDR
jgi:YfiH family protein